MSEPALAKASRYGSQGAIIRCTSKIFLVCGRSAFTTSGPMVMFGTKCPSMTSTWTQSQPALSMARTSSPSRAKSAERIDGAMMMSRAIKAGSSLPVGHNPRVVEPRLRPFRHNVEKRYPGEIQKGLRKGEYPILVLDTGFRRYDELGASL